MIQKSHLPKLKVAQYIRKVGNMANQRTWKMLVHRSINQYGMHPNITILPVLGLIQLLTPNQKWVIGIQWYLCSDPIMSKNIFVEHVDLLTALLLLKINYIFTIYKWSLPEDDSCGAR